MNNYWNLLLRCRLMVNECSCDWPYLPVDGKLNVFLILENLVSEFCFEAYYMEGPFIFLAWKCESPPETDMTGG